MFFLISVMWRFVKSIVTRWTEVPTSLFLNNSLFLFFFLVVCISIQGNTRQNFQLAISSCCRCNVGLRWMGGYKVGLATHSCHLFLLGNVFIIFFLLLEFIFSQITLFISSFSHSFPSPFPQYTNDGREQKN